MTLTLVFLGRAPKDHAVLRALNALIAALPASESPEFREEFDTASYLFICIVLKRKDTH